MQLQTKPNEFIDGSQFNDQGIFESKVAPYGPNKFAVGIRLFPGQEVTFIVNGEPIHKISA